MKSSQHTESLQQALMHPARDQFWYLKPATLCLSAGLKSLLHSSWEMAGSLSYYKCLCKGFLTWCQLYSLAALLKCSLWAGVRRGIHSSELRWHGEQSWAAGLGNPASCCQLLDLHEVTPNILPYKTTWCFCSYLHYSRCCICCLRAELNAGKQRGKPASGAGAGGFSPQLVTDASLQPGSLPDNKQSLQLLK